MSLRPKDYAGAALAVALAAGCVRLGFWQLHRLHQRRARNAVIAAARALPPLELPAAGVPAESLAERRVRARGTYDWAREHVWHARTYQGAPGVTLITPLRLADGSWLLVDRGWAPSADAYHVDGSRFHEADTATIAGLAEPAPRDRGDADPRRFADSLGGAVLPLVVQLLPGDTNAHLPPGLVRWPAPELDEGPHLSYTIQWFSFAAIILVGTFALLRKQAREGH
jgi:surfeit locus 1 family protein